MKVVKSKLKSLPLCYIYFTSIWMHLKRIYFGHPSTLRHRF